MAAAVVGASAIAAAVADNVDGAGAGCASAMQFQTDVYMVLHVTRVSWECVFMWISNCYGSNKRAIVGI